MSTDIYGTAESACVAAFSIDIYTMDKRGYLLQPRSAEITRQRATNVDTLFPSSQPSLYNRLKAQVSTLWTYLFTPASEPPPSPHKRPSSEVVEQPKRFKPVPPNRFSLASSSQEGEEDPKPAPPEKKYFTPVLTRSHLRAFSRPKEETKVIAVAPANPKLQKSPPVLDRDFEARVIREEFERQAQAILDKRVAEAVPMRSKTPTPKRDDLGGKTQQTVKLPLGGMPAKKTSPDVSKVAEVVTESVVEPAKPVEPIESPPKPPANIPPKPAVPAKVLPDNLPSKPAQIPVQNPVPLVEVKDRPAAPVELPPVPEKAGPDALSQPAGFFAKAEEFKKVEPESPGFVLSDSSQEKESELSPIKDFCAKPEAPASSALLPKPLPSTSLQPNPFQLEPAPANPFAGPPPPNNPFLMPAAAPSTSVFVFGSAQPILSAPPPVLNPPPGSNPFLVAPAASAPVPAWQPRQPSEDAEMRAETPRAPFAAVQSQPPLHPAVQPQASFPYQPFGAFQTSLAAQPPPQSNAGSGSFSIGQVGNRRIYRAKRPGQ